MFKEEFAVYKISILQIINREYVATNFNQLYRIEKVTGNKTFFLVTVPLFIVVHIERDYHKLIRYQFVWSEIAGLFAASFIITALLFLMVRNFRRAAAYAIPVMLVNYFFCDVKDALHEWNDKIFLSSYSFLLPAMIAFVFVSFYFIRRAHRDFKRLFQFVNIAFLLFIFFDLALIAGSKLNPGSGQQTSIMDGYESCDSCARPDIYYIVFDAYTSSAVLQSEFNYDNSRLDSMLTSRGFYIIRKSFSNYNLTPFSVGSTLNAEYIQSLNTKKEFYLNEYLPGISVVRRSRLVPVLKHDGYQVFNHSIFPFEGAPSTIPVFDLWELNLVYEQHNIIKKIDRDIGWKLWPRFHFSGTPASDREEYARQRDRFFENTMENLMQTIKSNSRLPKFIYAHILLPHSPYTFDSVGNNIPFSDKSLPVEEDKKAYLNQLAYANKMIQEITDSIFVYSKGPFVVILQGDHGYKFNSPGKNNLEFANLNAMYFYNKDYRWLHDSLSNVNTFRVIFNTFFGKNYPLLKDRSYFLQYR